MNYSKQSLQFQIGQIGDSEKRILKYGKQFTSFELQRSSCFLKKSPLNQCTILLDGENDFLFCHCDRLFLILGIKKTADCTHTARVNGQFFGVRFFVFSLTNWNFSFLFVQSVTKLVHNFRKSSWNSFFPVWTFYQLNFTFHLLP